MPEFVHQVVEAYLAGLSAPEDAVMEDVRRRSAQDGVPALNPAASAVLAVLAQAARPSRIFEIGTGYGCSGLHLARALQPGGLLFTVERNPARAAVAREFFARAGLADRTNVMVGESVRLMHKVAGPFDVIFQDGSKDQYEPMLDRLVDLLRPRGLLLTDNLLWQGDVVPGFRETPAHTPESIDAIVRFTQRLVSDPRLHTVVLPVGDGLALSVKRDNREHA